MSLKIFAYLYQRELNRAVIPCKADKSPALNSTLEYQNRLSTSTELDTWFSSGRVAAIGQMMGGNRLALDLDDQSAVADFVATFPHLAKTHRETTPRGMHYVFTIIPGTAKNIKVAGRGSIIYEGLYIVRAPSPGYHIQQGGQPLELSPDDYRAVVEWLTGKSAPPPAPTSPSRTTAIQPAAVAPARNRPSANPRQLLTIYAQHLTAGKPRNDALFMTLSWARDHGMTAKDDYELLKVEHVYATPPPGHRRESTAARYREFERTLKSAFSYPIRDTDQPQRVGLPNRIRETLAQRGMTPVWRVLETLVAAGVNPGQTITRQSVAAICSPAGVGRHSRITALESGIFLKVSPLAPHQNATAVLLSGTTDDNQCPLKDEKIGKNSFKAGRRATVYTMPSLEQVSEWLKIQHDTRGDKLTADDLKTAKSSRRALLERYVARNPGAQWSNEWQADRIGVTVRTIQTYKQDLKLVSEPQSKPVNWLNVDSLPAPEMGHYLKIEGSSKRYPTVPGLAKALLSSDAIVSLCTKTPHHYALPGQMPKAVYKLKLPPAPAKPRTFLKPEYPAPVHFAPNPAPKSIVEPLTTSKQSDNPMSAVLEDMNEVYRREYRYNPRGELGLNLRTSKPFSRPLSGADYHGHDFEETAQLVYQTCNELAADNTQKVSIRAARRLVYQRAFNSGFVHDVTKHLDTIKAKPGLRSPFGYLSYLVKRG